MQRYNWENVFDVLQIHIYGMYENYCCHLQAITVTKSDTIKEHKDLLSWLSKYTHDCWYFSQVDRSASGSAPISLASNNN
jgi:hypothetical protein